MNTSRGTSGRILFSGLVILIALLALPRPAVLAISPAPFVRVMDAHPSDAKHYREDVPHHVYVEAGMDPSSIYYSSIYHEKKADRDISTLVAEGVMFFASILVIYLFVGTAASFVEAQWGTIIGSTGKAFPQIAGKIGQLALAVILALLVYPLVNWVTSVLLGDM